MLYRHFYNVNKPSKLFYIFAHSKSYYKITLTPDRSYLHKCWLTQENLATPISMPISIDGLIHRRVTTRKSSLFHSSVLHTTAITYTTNRLVLNLVNQPRLENDSRLSPVIKSTVLFLFSEYWAATFVKNWWSVFFYTTFFTNSNLQMFSLFSKSWGNTVTTPANRGLLTAATHNTRYI